MGYKGTGKAFHHQYFAGAKGDNYWYSINCQQPTRVLYGAERKPNHDLLIFKTASLRQQTAM
jgi:hypothetical protein